MAGAEVGEDIDLAALFQRIVQHEEGRHLRRSLTEDFRRGLGEVDDRASAPEINPERSGRGQIAIPEENGNRQRRFHHPPP